MTNIIEMIMNSALTIEAKEAVLRDTFGDAIGFCDKHRQYVWSDATEEVCQVYRNNGKTFERDVIGIPREEHSELFIRRNGKEISIILPFVPTYGNPKVGAIAWEVFSNFPDLKILSVNDENLDGDGERAVLNTDNVFGEHFDVFILPIE